MPEVGSERCWPSKSKSYHRIEAGEYHDDVESGSSEIMMLSFKFMQSREIRKKYVLGKMKFKRPKLT